MNKLKDRHQKFVNEEKKKDNKLEEKKQDIISSKSIASDNEKQEHLIGVSRKRSLKRKNWKKNNFISK